MKNEIISVDDHVVEPPTVWTDRLPAARREAGPRVERAYGSVTYPAGRAVFVEGDGENAGPVAGWTDVWHYEDVRWPLHAGLMVAGDRDRHELQPVTFDDIAAGCWQQKPRLAEMDLNHTEASLCFPTVPRFCGQLFLEAKDRDLALLCVKAYNDWMIDEWCAGDAYGRLIPLTIVPLWDVELAVAEVERCAAKGSHAITFSESPPALGLPSMHSGYWDPLLAACERTDTVVNMHVGSSSRLPKTSDDANLLVIASLIWQNSVHALVDWVLSGSLARFPDLRVALSEGQVGWIPFVLERMDVSWELRSNDRELRALVPERPSSYVADRVFGCIFDDLVGLQMRDSIGMGQICFETDYPHVDSTYPHSLETADRLVQAAGLSETERWQFLRGNAIRCYGLERYGITKETQHPR
ncbi:MAG TPA: amidohydrolase family protein [Acidimicrobiales bacterium]|nr:amidohydrolase family protein [Acidimicrobiales bacterium]